MMLRFLAVALSLQSLTTAFTSPASQQRFSTTELNALDRRAFVGAAAAAVLSSTTTPAAAFAATDSSATKILVLGGTGLVGSRVVSKLKSMGIDVIATSTNGRDGTVALDFTSANVAQEVESLASSCTAVISTVGVIGSKESTDDGTINAASGLAAIGAKKAGATKFVYISVAPEVKQLAVGIDFLNSYMEGKQFSEDNIASSFGDNGILIAPTFIYGGNSFGLTPPRVTTQYGQLIEGLLSSGPVRALAEVAPEGIIKIGLEPPVSAQAVADAAIAGALGKTTGTTFDTYDKIEAAAKAV